MRAMRLQLLATSALAVAAVLVAGTAPAGSVLRVVAGIPLVVLLPGWAIVDAVDPTRSIGVVERVATALAGSFVVSVLAGAALGFAGVRLAAVAWALVLGAVTVAADVVAAVRLRGAQAVDEPGALRLPFAPLAAVFCGLIALAFVTLSLTRLAPMEPSTGRVVQLWALPESGAATGTVRIGVRNVVSTERRWELRVAQGGAVLSQRVLDVPPGASASIVVTASPDATAPLSADLTALEDLTLRRSVWLFAPAE